MEFRQNNFGILNKGLPVAPTCIQNNALHQCLQYLWYSDLNYDTVTYIMIVTTLMIWWRLTLWYIDLLMIQCLALWYGEVHYDTVAYIMIQWLWYTLTYISLSTCYQCLQDHRLVANCLMCTEDKLTLTTLQWVDLLIGGEKTRWLIDDITQHGNVVTTQQYSLILCVTKNKTLLFRVDIITAQLD